MSNAQKLPLQVSLGRIAQAGANRAVNILGKSLPASVVEVNGRIVTIKFEVLSDYNMPNIDVPLAGSEYTIEPIQPGCKGVVIALDADISGVSGQSENTADLFSIGNLSSLVFFPIGNKKRKAVDPNIYYATGLSDVMLRDDDHQVTLEDMNTAYLSLISQLNAWVPILSGFGITVPAITTAVNPVKPRV